MNIPYYLIGVAFFIGVVTFLIGLRQGPQEAPETAAEKLSRVRARKDEISPDAAKAKIERELDREFAKREEARVKQQRRETYVPSMSKFVMAFRPIHLLEEELLQARSPWRASELLVASVFAAAVTLIILLWMELPFLIALPLSLLWLIGPWVAVRVMKATYARRFEVQLADTLMMMANGLRAGFSFLQTMEMVSRESQPPISDEFQRMTQEIAVGVPVNQALENMAARVKSSDLDLVVTAVLIQREVGSSLAEVLEIIAGVIGERLRIRGEIRTLTAQGRLTGMVLGFLPLSLGLVLHLVGRVMTPHEPSFVYPLISTDAGRTMLVIGLVMQVIGFAIIMKIVAIKV